MTSADLLATALDDLHARVAPGGLQVGVVFAGHHLIEELGRGGMGVVFSACHIASNRIVALKVPHANATPELLRRFRAEAEAAAALSHPGILAVYEVGEIDGQPYFTMEFAECGSLGDRVADFVGKPRAVAELLARVAEAVQHAHERGLLHRDLKPSNILLATPDQPRVADFGLSRWLGRESDITDSLAVLGTPDYLAPEAALGARHALTTAADIFSLGAMLYHLLAGQPPFRGASVAETLRRVAGEAPRALGPEVPGDLAAICLKALEREPARRFSTARELAGDLGRFLRGEPIHARPAPPLAIAWRWCRRRPALATLLALLVVVLVVAFVIIDSARRAEAGAKTRAELASQQLRDANTRIESSLDFSELERAEESFAAGDSVQGVALLARVVRRNPSHATAGQRLASAFWHGDFVLPRGREISVGGKISRLQFLQDSATLLIVTGSGAGLWDTATGNRRHDFEHDGSHIVANSLSDDGRHLAAWDDRDGKSYVLWDVATGRRIMPPVPHTGWLRTIAFAPDGAHFLAAGGELPARLRDTLTGAVTGAALPHPQALGGALFSPDGATIATSEGVTVRLWDSATQELRATLPPFDSVVELLRFAPGSHYLVVATRDYALRFYSLTDGRIVGAPMWHDDLATTLSFSNDGLRMISASDDHSARIWAVPDGKLLVPPLRHRDSISFAAFSPDGERVVTCARDNSSRLWDARSGRPLSQPLRTAEQPRVAAFTPDGGTLYIGGAEGVVQSWDVRGTQPAPVLLDARNRVHSAEFSADGKWAVTGSENGNVAVWNSATAKPIMAPGHHTGAVLEARFSGNGQRIAIGTDAHGAWVSDVAGQAAEIGPFEHAGRVLDVCLSADGNRLATAGEDGSARVWNVDTRTPLTPLLSHADSVVSVRFSASGKTLLTASLDGTARLWDAGTGQPLGHAMIHDDGVLAAEFSPDGRLIATASLDNSARIWDAQTAAPVSPPLRHTRTVSSIAFSPDSARVVTASWDGTARVWDARTGHPLTRAMTHDDHVTDAQFSPNGRRIATASQDKTARIWDAATGLPITEPLRHPSAVEHIRFHPDNRHFMTTAPDATRIWEAPDFSSLPPAWLLAFAEFIARSELPSNYQSTLTRVPQDQVTEPEDAFARLARRFVEH